MGRPVTPEEEASSSHQSRQSFGDVECEMRSVEAKNDHDPWSEWLSKRPSVRAPELPTRERFAPEDDRSWPRMGSARKIERPSTSRMDEMESMRAHEAPTSKRFGCEDDRNWHRIRVERSHSSRSTKEQHARRSTEQSEGQRAFEKDSNESEVRTKAHATSHSTNERKEAEEKQTNGMEAYAGQVLIGGSTLRLLQRLESMMPMPEAASSSGGSPPPSLTSKSLGPSSSSGAHPAPVTLESLEATGSSGSPSPPPPSLTTESLDAVEEKSLRLLRQWSSLPESRTEPAQEAARSASGAQDGGNPQDP